MANNTEKKNLIVEEEAGLVTLTMNRPEKRNALSSAMMTELNDELRAIGERGDARAVIIAGNGPAFSAGHDLGELKGRDLAFYRYEFDLCAQLMLTIQRIPQPVIARVHGDRDGRRMPAGGDVRSRRRRRERELRHAGREDRTVLLDADGRADARRRHASMRWKCC